MSVKVFMQAEILPLSVFQVLRAKLLLNLHFFALDESVLRYKHNCSFLELSVL